MRYSILTSGSCGNSYAFYDGKTTILIDVGLTLTGLKRRLVDADIPYSHPVLFLWPVNIDAQVESVIGGKLEIITFRIIV